MRLQRYGGVMRIVCAANRKDDHIFIGVRHCDKLMATQADAVGMDLTCSEQGFIDTLGDFYTREEALAIVLENKQTFYPERNGSTTQLFSEGLY